MTDWVVKRLKGYELAYDIVTPDDEQNYILTGSYLLRVDSYGESHLDRYKSHVALYQPNFVLTLL